MASSDGARPLQLDVAAYRDAISELRSDLERRDLSDQDAYSTAIYETLQTPVAAAALDLAGSALEELAARALRAAQSFRPREAATAGSHAHEVQILLLQQIDLAWWRTSEDFDSDEDVRGSEHLVDMRPLRRSGEVDFAFSIASDRLGPRVAKFAVRRWFPRRGPGTPGLSSPYARPQMVALLNSIASEFAARAGSSAPPLWINCITRSVADQCRLQDLGFSAHYPSAHCRGWAADLEVGWFARFGLRETLTGVLEELRDAGQINAIDEGRIWHVCPNPELVRAWSGLTEE